MPSSSYTLLVVEDESGGAELEASHLLLRGFQVRVASSAAECLELLRGQSIDLIVMDVLLPAQVTAFELIPQVRRIQPDIPVILVTGVCGEQTVIEALRMGVRDFVPKTAHFLDHLIASVERVVESLRTRRLLAEAESRFQRFMDHSPAIAFIKEQNGKLVYANQQFGIVCGCADPRELTDFDLWEHETAGTLRGHDEQVLAAQKPQQFSETLRTPDGQTYHWLTYRFPLTRGGAESLLAGMAVDVTSQREAEAQLREKEAQLRHAQKMEAIGQLAGGVAHDFNNLLTVIQGYADILLECFSSDETASMIHEIRRASRRAEVLTRQLLVFSRRQSPKFTTCNINDTVVDIDKMLRRLIGEHIQLTLQLDPHLAWVRADLSDLEQIVVNLVVNARDAMSEGGEIIIETANVPSDGSAPTAPDGAMPGDYVMLAVRDTGCGMDAATRSKIFEPFFTTKEPGKGTGLGLATVYGAVSQCGGRIAVDSEPGMGSTFRIYLPRVEPPAGEREAVGECRRRPGNETILVVEDDDAVRAVVVETLRRVGYNLIEAADPLDAMRASQEYVGDIHLLLTDAVMPHGGGGRLAELLTLDRPEMQVLFISGYPEESFLRTGVLQHKCALLPKPFTPESLLYSVRELLDLGLWKRREHLPLYV